MNQNTNFEHPPSLLADHPVIVDAFTTPYTLLDYLPVDTHDRFQEDKNDTLTARKYFTDYLEQCLNEGHQESVWGALNEIAAVDPFASVYLALTLRKSAKTRAIKQETADYINYLIIQHPVLQNNEEIMLPLLDAEYEENPPILCIEDYYDEPYSEIGETAIAKAYEDQYLEVLLLIQKITDPDTHAVYLNRISTIFGDRALELDKEGKHAVAQEIVDLIPIISLRTMYEHLLKEQ